MDILERGIMRVKINQYMFDIVEEFNGEHVYYKEKEDGLYRIGLMNPIEQRIYLYSGLSYELKRNTLAHELTHAFLFAHGLDGKELDEEMICDFVSLYHERITEIINCYFLKGGD